MSKINHCLDDIGIWIKYNGHKFNVAYDMRLESGEEFERCEPYGLQGLYKSECGKELDMASVTHVRLPNLNKRPSLHFKSNLDRIKWHEAGEPVLRPKGTKRFGK